tara:strand:+ start:2893 stop:3561 length:669 start_codon:yes stop_codon:yes gene_type:complete
MKVDNDISEFNALRDDAVYHDLSTNDEIMGMDYNRYIDMISKNGTSIESYNGVMSPYYKYIHAKVFNKLGISYNNLTKKVDDCDEYEEKMYHRWGRDEQYRNISEEYETARFEALDEYVNEKPHIKVGDIIQSFDTYGGRWHYHMSIVGIDKIRIGFGEGIGTGDAHNSLSDEDIKRMKHLDYTKISKILAERYLIPWIDDDDYSSTLLWELHQGDYPKNLE